MLKSTVASNSLCAQGELKRKQESKGEGKVGDDDDCDE